MLILKKIFLRLIHRRISTRCTRGVLVKTAGKERVNQERLGKQ